MLSRRDAAAPPWAASLLQRLRSRSRPPQRACGRATSSTSRSCCPSSRTPARSVRPPRRSPCLSSRTVSRTRRTCCRSRRVRDWCSASSRLASSSAAPTPSIANSAACRRSARRRCRCPRCGCSATTPRCSARPSWCATTSLAASSTTRRWAPPPRPRSAARCTAASCLRSPRCILLTTRRPGLATLGRREATWRGRRRCGRRSTVPRRRSPTPLLRSCSRGCRRRCPPATTR
mmetsp:Transcript_14695/g.47187  ORF Transcript_14695/g.47187 Transcript_14695/m.47187 type:complete len:233 (+) Transcript_14695:12-710(+)